MLVGDSRAALYQLRYIISVVATAWLSLYMIFSHRTKADHGSYIQFSYVCTWLFIMDIWRSSRCIGELYSVRQFEEGSYYFHELCCSYYVSVMHSIRPHCGSCIYGQNKSLGAGCRHSSIFSMFHTSCRFMRCERRNRPSPPRAQGVPKVGQRGVATSSGCGGFEMKSRRVPTIRSAVAADLP